MGTPIAGIVRHMRIVKSSKQETTSYSSAEGGAEPSPIIILYMSRQTSPPRDQLIMMEVLTRLPNFDGSLTRKSGKHMRNTTRAMYANDNTYLQGTRARVSRIRCGKQVTVLMNNLAIGSCCFIATGKT